MSHRDTTDADGNAAERSVSHVIFHMDDATVDGSSTVDSAAAAPAVADAPRIRGRLPSARSSAGSELEELAEEAALTAAVPDPFKHRPSPYLSAGLFSRVTWSWLDSFLKLGSSKTLTEEDMYELMPRDQAKVQLEATMKACKQVEDEIGAQEQKVSERTPSGAT